MCKWSEQASKRGDEKRGGEFQAVGADCVGPEIEETLAWSRNCKEARLPGVESEKRRARSHKALVLQQACVTITQVTRWASHLEIH